MKILVAGGSGFIGSHLLPALVSAGHEVYNLTRKVPETLRPGVISIRCDLGQLSACNLPDVEVVIHLAQSNIRFPEGAEDLLTINCTSAVKLALMGIAQSARKFIYASTGNVYGLSPTPSAESSPLLGGGFYAESKIAAERMLGELRQKIQLDILRVFSPYGPGQQPFRLIPDVINRIREGRPVSVRANGMPILSPIYVEDAVEATLKRIACSDHLTMNLAGDQILSIETMARDVGRLLGKSPVFEPIIDGMTGGIAGHNALLHEVLNRDPLPWEEGLERYLQSLKP